MLPIEPTFRESLMKVPLPFDPKRYGQIPPPPYTHHGLLKMIYLAQAIHESLILGVMDHVIS